MSWKLIHNEHGSKFPKTIVNPDLPDGISVGAYDYNKYIPIALVPMGKFTTLVVSEYVIENRVGDSALGIRIQDINFNQEWNSSINFILRGNSYHRKKLQYALLRGADADGCVGMTYLLKRLNYIGFSSIYVPKKLSPKVNSTLESALTLTKIGGQHGRSKHDNRGTNRDDVK